MTARRWTVTTSITGTPRAVEVVLYSDVNHLRGAATRHNAWSRERATYKNALGVCHGFTRYSIDADGNEIQDETVAIIRLCLPYLTPLVITHEVAHAAQHIYGLDHITEGDLADDHMHAGNEEFAHLYGELFGAIWPMLREQAHD